MVPYLRGKCICGLSSRVEYVSCTYEKLAKYFLWLPNMQSITDSCFELLVLQVLTHRCLIGTLLSAPVSNQLKLYISTVWDQTLSLKMTMLTPIIKSSQIYSSEVYQKLPLLTKLLLKWSSCSPEPNPREQPGRAVHSWVTLNIIGWPVTNAGWTLGCHPPAVCPSWWGSARLLWLCVVLPHATEAPVYKYVVKF